MRKPTSSKQRKVLLQKKLSYRLTNLFKKRSAAAKKGWATRRAYQKIAKKPVKQYTKKEVAIYHRVKAFKVKRAIAKRAAQTRKQKAFAKERIRKEFRVAEYGKIEGKPFEIERKPIEIATGPTAIQPIPVEPEEPKEEGKEAERVIDMLKEYVRFNDIENEINYTKLNDGSEIIESKFFGIEDVDSFLQSMSVNIQTLELKGKMKTSVGFIFDPSEIVKPMETKGDEVTIGKKPYDFYKGMIDIPSNVSESTALQFLDARRTIYPGIKEVLGVEPKTIRIIFLLGESVLGSKIPRAAARDIKLFE